MKVHPEFTYDANPIVVHGQTAFEAVIPMAPLSVDPFAFAGGECKSSSASATQIQHGFESHDVAAKAAPIPWKTHEHPQLGPLLKR